MLSNSVAEIYHLKTKKNVFEIMNEMHILNIYFFILQGCYIHASVPLRLLAETSQKISEHFQNVFSCF